MRCRVLYPGRGIRWISKRYVLHAAADMKPVCRPRHGVGCSGLHRVCLIAFNPFGIFSD